MARSGRGVDERRDAGYTLVELLVVVVVLGILATVVLLSVGSARDDAEQSACQTDYRQLQTAWEAYKARYHDEVPEAALVPEFLKEQSQLYDIAADGTITSTHPDCEVPATFGPAVP
jgi:prepilin-type N-terminal cleavage/methylation domain-containing protein